MNESTNNVGPPDCSATFQRPHPYDFDGTLRFLRLGGNDPCFLRERGRVTTTVRTSEGAAVLQLSDGETLSAAAWGPGAVQAIQRAPAWLGLNDDPVCLGHLHPVVAALEKHNPGLRLPDTREVFQGLLRTIPQQLVTWEEAAAGWGWLARRLGRLAPAPGDRFTIPTPDAVRACSMAELQSMGLLPKMARTMIECARRANRLEALVDEPLDDLMRKLQVIRGVGPWTAGQVAGFRLGRADAIILGDLGLPHTVAYTLTGKPKSDDGEMLDLLEPFRPHRFRIVRLIMHAGKTPPRRAPRADLWRC